MRQSIGGAWLFSISITLMMFIIAYVAITIDYSNAYQLKNDVVLLIEQYNGLNNYSAPKIVKRMTTRKFSTFISCSKDYDSSTYYEAGPTHGVASTRYYALTSFQKTNAKDNYGSKTQSEHGELRGYLCIYKYMQPLGEDNYKTGSHSGGSLDKAFYAVTTSFGFNFPILGNVFNYRVTGETGTINYPDDTGFPFDH